MLKIWPIKEFQLMIENMIRGGKMAYPKKKVKVSIGYFKNSEVFQIHEIDENGEEIGEYPLISFGRMKANLILDHMDDILAFAQGRPLDKKRVNGGIDIEDELPF